MEINKLQYGSADNAAQYRAAFKPPTPDITKRLVLKNLNLSPMTGNFNDLNCPYIALCYSTGRCILNNWNKGLATIGAIGELLTSTFKDDAVEFRTETEAREAFVISINALISSLDIHGVTNMSGKEFSEFLLEEGNAEMKQKFVAGSFPVILVRGTSLTPEDCLKILLGMNRPQYRKEDLGAGFLLNIYMAFTKRGQVSDGFLYRTSSKSGLGGRILQRDLIGNIYKYYVSDIDFEKIGNLMTEWQSAWIHPSKIHENLLFNQLKFANLTQIHVICRALKSYADFDWETVNLISGSNELDAVHRTIDAIGSNHHYGLNPDLKATSSRYFKTMAWTAKTLLVRKGGEKSLEFFRGWIQNVPNRDKLEVLIQNYVPNTVEVGPGQSEIEVTNPIEHIQVLVEKAAQSFLSN